MFTRQDVFSWRATIMSLPLNMLFSNESQKGNHYLTATEPFQLLQPSHDSESKMNEGLRKIIAYQTNQQVPT
jgi:hypothetical protein